MNKSARKIILSLGLVVVLSGLSIDFEVNASELNKKNAIVNNKVDDKKELKQTVTAGAIYVSGLSNHADNFDSKDLVFEVFNKEGKSLGTISTNKGDKLDIYNDEVKSVKVIKCPKYIGFTSKPEIRKLDNKNIYINIWYYRKIKYKISVLDSKTKKEVKGVNVGFF